MLRIVLICGLISGVILGGFTALMVPMCMNQTMDNAEVVGYTAMALAFLSVFFGIRTYRQNVMGGHISFGQAFKVGILITLVTSAVYVASWEVVYYGFFPDFGDRYSARVLEKMKEGGASEEKIAAETAKMETFKRLYKNPFFNVGMTFLEVFPVGLVVSLVSAGILRKRATPSAPLRGATADVVS